jgi:glutathione peroxidase
MFSKIDVNGDGACELYQWLREQTGGADIQWNFEKFLIDRDGNVAERLNPMVTPEEIAPKAAELL